MKKIMKRSASLLAAAGASAGLLFAASPAMALDYDPTPAVDGEILTVTSENEYEAGSYRIGICTKAQYATVIPGVSAPACGAYSGQIDTTTTGVISGDTTEVYATENNNDHYEKLKGDQPRTFDCNAGQCEVVIVSHADGQGGTYLEQEDLVFK